MVLQELLNLINSCNIYVKECSENKDSDILESIGRYITHILQTFGLTELSNYYSTKKNEQEVKQENTLPIVRMLATFRSEIRELAFGSAGKSKRYQHKLQIY